VIKSFSGYHLLEESFGSVSQESLVAVHWTILYLGPGWQLGLSLGIAGIHGRGTPGISCLYVEEVFAGSGPSNQVGVDRCVARFDSGVSPGAYLGVLRACHEKENN
jgi:hypothetical protein